MQKLKFSALLLCCNCQLDGFIFHGQKLLVDEIAVIRFKLLTI